MIERVKIFTQQTGMGAPVQPRPLEEAINQWLETTPGRLRRIRQSECERPGIGHQVTICIWYVPGDVEPDFQIPF